MRDQLGVVHGRFQLLHNEHIKYILAAKARCDHLIIGICNPDATLTKYAAENPHRSQIASNPFTYYERYQMIHGAMIEHGITLNEFDIVPFPINHPELIFNYAPSEAKFYMTIYDEWGRSKKKMLEDIGCHVEVMWQRDISEKVLSGTDVRTCIRMNMDWKQYVPQFVYQYIQQNHLDDRIRQCNY